MAGEMAERIGARIRERRLELDMKQRELADKLDSDAIDNQRISDWERGVNRPSDRYMEKLADALGRDVSWFYRENPDAETPDLSLVKSDSDRLASIEAKLDGGLVNQQNMQAQIDQQNENLAAQTEILSDLKTLVGEIRSLVAVLQDAEIIERSAAAAVRSLPEWPAPPGPAAAPVQEPQRATGTTGRAHPRAPDQRRKPSRP